MSTPHPWIEAAINGGTGQALQPRIPIAPDAIIAEAVECAAAGAAIIHLHAYDEAGASVEDADIYARIIEGIRARCDAIVYPTLALAGSTEERYAPVVQLGEKGLLEWGVVDPGSVNITHRMMVDTGRDGVLYANPDADIRAGLELAREHGWHPSFAVYEPGFARNGAAWSAQLEGLPQPIYRAMLSRDFLFGLPPEDWCVEAYARLLADVAPGAPYMVAVLGGDISEVTEAALKHDAHIRVGLEDMSFGCERSNLELVRDAVARVEAAGRTPASPSQVREALAGK